MAEQALGTKIKIGVNSIADLTSISGLALSADTRETTTLDSNGYRTFERGLIDPGEVSLSGYFNPNDENGQYALLEALNAGDLIDYSICFPAKMGAEWQFQGIVTSYETGADLEDNISFDATIKVSGKPNLLREPSTGLSALTISGSVGAVLTPTFDDEIYLYTFTTKAATVKITATAVGHSIKLYVDGVHTKDLTSGVETSAFSISGGSKKINLVVSEPGKAAKVYEIIVAVPAE